MDVVFAGLISSGSVLPVNQEGLCSAFQELGMIESLLKVEPCSDSIFQFCLAIGDQLPFTHLLRLLDGCQDLFSSAALDFEAILQNCSVVTGLGILHHAFSLVPDYCLSRLVDSPFPIQCIEPTSLVAAWLSRGLQGCRSVRFCALHTFAAAARRLPEAGFDGILAMAAIVETDELRLLAIAGLEPFARFHVGLLTSLCVQPDDFSAREIAVVLVGRVLAAGEGTEDCLLALAMVADEVSLFRPLFIDVLGRAREGVVINTICLALLRVVEIGDKACTAVAKRLLVSVHHRLIENVHLSAFDLMKLLGKEVTIESVGELVRSLRS